MNISNKELHKEGVAVVMGLLPDTHIESGRGKKFDYINSDTEFILRNKASGSDIDYEIRVGVTHGEIKNNTVSWMLIQHNLESVHPRFFYAFVHIDRETTPTTNRLFLVPSKVVSTYLKSNYNTKENGKKKLYNFTIDLSNKRIDKLIATDYEDRWDLLK